MDGVLGHPYCLPPIARHKELLTDLVPEAHAHNTTRRFGSLDLLCAFRNVVTVGLWTPAVDCLAGDCPTGFFKLKQQVRVETSACIHPQIPNARENSECHHELEELVRSLVR